MKFVAQSYFLSLAFFVAVFVSMESKEHNEEQKHFTTIKSEYLRLACRFAYLRTIDSQIQIAGELYNQLKPLQTINQEEKAKWLETLSVHKQIAEIQKKQKAR